MKLSYVRLLVDDFDKCFDFYSNTMRLTVTWGKLGDVYASFDTGSQTALSIFSKPLMFQSLEKDTPKTSNSQLVICFESDNVDEDYTTLLDLGVNFLDKPTDMTGWGCRCVHLTDPEGNIIELNQELSKEKWDKDLLDNDPANNP